MKTINPVILISAILILDLFRALDVSGINNNSVYTGRLNDPEAVYFTPEEFNIKADGSVDVSLELQKAINQLKKEKNFGIIFVPEGTYLISKTIYIPKAIRLIGYGEKRPLIILGENSPGYQAPVTSDKGQANYMFWFTGRLVEEGDEPRDAGAGTFYSAISNIDLKIGDGNPHAVALRTHFAQHSFIANVNIYIGNGKAGIFDVGNEMENVAFFGGDYGIYTTKTSPSWPMMMIDTYFEGQRKAAIMTREAGLTIVRLKAYNVPAVIEIEKNYSDRIFMEECTFDSVNGPAITISNEDNHTNQISLCNIYCRDVPLLCYYRKSDTQTSVTANIYKINKFTHGLHINSMDAEPETRTHLSLEVLEQLPESPAGDIPELPAKDSWVNIAELGAVGDGVTDNTKVFLEAIKNYPNIYIPQGWYVVSQTLSLKPNTCLIGLHPIATQIKLLESTPAFSGFGLPRPLIEAPAGGKTIFTGIGINTGGYNYRAVGCKWMAGAESYMNDVKFVGGHGSMARGPYTPWHGRRTREISSPDNPVASLAADKAWDNQHWSLWITNGGGGTFKDIWTASTYSTNGIYVNNTSTEGRIYAMSVEHHVRNEARFKNVSNWKVYAFQLEEESREGMFCLPVELQECSNMVFANLYMFRVIRFNTPFPYSVRIWNCKDLEFLNVHNYAQIKFPTDLPFYDINKDIDVRPWEFTRLYITGNEVRSTPLTFAKGQTEKLVTGFEFAEGITSDSEDNIYFCEQRLKRIYKWNTESNTLTLVADFPWEPLSLACDTKDNLLVIFKYNPQPGYLINGEQESVPVLPDAAGSSFSGWGNSGFATWVYSIDPDNPEETISLLPRVSMDSVKHIAKALYPSNRWRDSHDFDAVVISTPEYCFVAPDGVTIIPECYDLARSSSVIEAFPGKPLYVSDEYDRRLVKIKVSKDGKLSDLEYFAEQAEVGSAVDSKGNVYIADGHIYIFDQTGERTGMIEVPERPSSIRFGGKDGNTLFITARSSLYGIILNDR
jgi:hypothetical protein